MSSDPAKEAAHPSGRFSLFQNVFAFARRLLTGSAGQSGTRRPPSKTGLRAELMVYAAGLLLFLGLLRLAVVYLSLGLDADSSWSQLLQPAYLIQDAAAFLLFLGLALLPGIIPGFTSSPMFRALLGGLCFLVLGLASISALRYFAVYELHFEWSHLSGGSRELWSSVVKEIDGVMMLRVALLALLTIAWTVAARSVLRSSQTSRRERAFAFAFFSMIGLALAIGTGLAPSEGKTQGFEIRRERSHNIALRLLLPYGDSQAPAGNAIAPATKTTPFSFDFPTESLTNKERKPRVAFPDKGKRRNVVLYIFESTSAEYIGRKLNTGRRKGKSLTPVWDRLARNSMRFRNHHAENPLSINALFTLLTSAYSMPADRWAATEFPRLEPAGLAQRLRENGYRTAILHTGGFDYARQRAFLNNRGFDVMLDAKVMKRPPYTKMINWGIDDRAFLEPAVKFAREARAAHKPFFMILQPVSPHHPYEIPEERFRVMPESAERSPRGGWYNRYVSSLFYSDYVMGRLIEDMEKSGFGEDTLYIIVADHGEAFGQHRRNYNHPFYVYQENVHVPFIIYNRTLFPTTRDYERVTRHIDIAPTILDLLNIPGDARFQGRSVLRAGPPVMATFRATWRNDIHGLRDGKWKYIRNRRTRRDELYDLSRDPGEKNNLAGEHPDLLKQYHEYLQRLTLHQKRYFEHVTGRTIDWNKRREYKE